MSTQCTPLCLIAIFVFSVLIVAEPQVARAEFSILSAGKTCINILVQKTRFLSPIAKTAKADKKFKIGFLRSFNVTKYENFIESFVEQPDRLRLVLNYRRPTVFATKIPIPFSKTISAEEKLAYVAATKIIANKEIPNVSLAVRQTPSDPFSLDDIESHPIKKFFKRRKFIKQVEKINLQAASADNIESLFMDLYTFHHANAFAMVSWGPALFGKMINKESATYRRWYKDAVLQLVFSLYQTTSFLATQEKLTGHIVPNKQEDPPYVNSPFWWSLKLPFMAVLNTYVSLNLADSLLYLPDLKLNQLRAMKKFLWLDQSLVFPLIPVVQNAANGSNANDSSEELIAYIMEKTKKSQIDKITFFNGLLNISRRAYLFLGLTPLVLSLADPILPVDWAPPAREAAQLIQTVNRSVTPAGRNPLEDFPGINTDYIVATTLNAVISSPGIGTIIYWMTPSSTKKDWSVYDEYQIDPDGTRTKIEK